MDSINTNQENIHLCYVLSVIFLIDEMNYPKGKYYLPGMHLPKFAEKQWVEYHQ
jgi:hypothetical protein